MLPVLESWLTIVSGVHTRRHRWTHVPIACLTTVVLHKSHIVYYIYMEQLIFKCIVSLYCSLSLYIYKSLITRETTIVLFCCRPYILDSQFLSDIPRVRFVFELCPVVLTMLNAHLLSVIHENPSYFGRPWRIPRVRNHDSRWTLYTWLPSGINNMYIM